MATSSASWTMGSGWPETGGSGSGSDGLRRGRGRGLEEGGALVAEALHAKEDRVADGLRQAHPAHGIAVHAVSRGGALHHLAQHLLEDEWVALGALEHQLVQLPVNRVG